MTTLKTSEKTLTVTKCDDCPFIYHYHYSNVCRLVGMPEGNVPPPDECPLREYRVVVVMSF